MNTNIQYSIVVPVYKSGLMLHELSERIGNVMQKQGSFELILVDDNSPDGITWNTIKSCAKEFSFIRGFRLLSNAGQFRATMCGFSKVRGDYVITMDDDLQHPPEELPKLIQAIKNDSSTLCYMGRYEVKQHNWFRNFGSKIFQTVLHYLCGKPKGLVTTSFRIMHRQLVDAILTSRSVKPQISPIILSITRSVKNVDVIHAPRQQGRSGYKLSKLISTTLETIVNSSTVPLRFFSFVGIMAACGSFLIGCYYFLRWCIFSISVAGYVSQILMLSFLGGMILLGIGIVGEYLSRIVNEITYPKIYFIRESTESSQE